MPILAERGRSSERGQKRRYYTSVHGRSRSERQGPAKDANLQCLESTETTQSMRGSEDRDVDFEEITRDADLGHGEEDAFEHCH